MKQLSVTLQHGPDVQQPVGTLAEQGRRIYFEYDPAFLEAGIELSPFKLRARPGLIEHTDLRFGPLPGLFDDSLPDGWGLLLMDRHFRREGLDPSTISVLDRLAFLGSRTMGALTYHPPLGAEPEGGERVVELHRLGRNAEEVLAGESTQVLPELERAGGSPGGARPKVLVGLLGDRVISGETDLPGGYQHWIVKFSSKADAGFAGPVEYAYALAAQAAGLDMSAARLFEVRQRGSVRRYFGTQRFDRAEGNRRVHAHTFGNLVHANFRIPSTDYTDLFRATQALTRNHADLLQLFRRMVFNIAMHNRDDHAKNFGYTLSAITREWSLAPAYDLTHSPGPGGEHTTTVLGEGSRPTRAHCLGLADQFGLKRRDTSAVFEAVNAAVDRWARFADEAGCARKVATAVAASLERL